MKEVFSRNGGTSMIKQFKYIFLIRTPFDYLKTFLIYKSYNYSIFHYQSWNIIYEFDYQHNYLLLNYHNILYFENQYHVIFLCTYNNY